MAKTVDNLGVEVSARYAEDKLFYDEKMVKESRVVPVQTEIDVTVPSFASEFEQLFETSRRNIFWADFFAPPKFNEQKKRLFTNQVIPSLGSSDKKEMQAARIGEIVAKDRAKQEEKEKEGKGKRPTWEEQKELEEEEREKTAILSLFKAVSAKERDFIDINSRRGQYHKG